MKNLKIIILFIVVFVFIAMLLNAGPPKPIVLSEGKKIPLMQGSYCWRKISGVECVDKISPPEIINQHKIIPVTISPQSEINITFKKAPIEKINVEEWVNHSKSKTMSVEDNVFSAPKDNGIYIYIISGKWEKGSSSYILTIKVE
ncbi:hypothetical protein P9B03_18880 [Metasolibacillus meyeri]|uniref:Uncharacterized protein n=1 Tax=Metasolibacillus meyeri TaxID=1071052 RepID=A0AAW9NVE4_9BACL|nr:hypothetical protein [Metasolibacillus meyeri]MEC1180531.1 hypothetical protein [Metasolibacillus meyeri]